ncbi:MAG: DUF1731 domain-containing protein [Fimbriimonadales bacterium]
MKIVIPGGSGHVGSALRRFFLQGGHGVWVLSRSDGSGWDGKTLGDWVTALEGADAVFNLAGRSVDCRYTPENLKEMMDSRVDSTRVLGEAIAAAKNPPKVWLQMSTATIYAHRFDAPNDEYTGIIGGSEPGTPRHWAKSIDIAKAWEAGVESAVTPMTRKVVMRSAMVMSPDKGSVFDTLATLTGRGLGGPVAGGRQFMSWVHEDDFGRAVQFLIENDVAGVVNIASPNPLPQMKFMAELRAALGVRIGLPASRWMLEIATRLMGTESELILKSRRVVSARLKELGFEFEFPHWGAAAVDLAGRRKELARKKTSVERH